MQEIRRLMGAPAKVAVILVGALLLMGAGSVEAAAKRKASKKVNVAKTAPAEGVLNVNNATLKELTYLPGIGLRKAERIVAYRTRRPFRRVYQLARVKGIGPKTVRKLRRWLRVKGPTTMTGPLRLKR